MCAQDMWCCGCTAAWFVALQQISIRDPPMPIVLVVSVVECDLCSNVVTDSIACGSDSVNVPWTGPAVCSSAKGFALGARFSNICEVLRKSCCKILRSKVLEGSCITGHRCGVACPGRLPGPMAKSRIALAAYEYTERSLCGGSVLVCVATDVVVLDKRQYACVVGEGSQIQYTVLCPVGFQAVRALNHRQQLSVDSLE
jgi:hypothetical protein